MRMKNDRDRRAALLGGMIAAFEAAGRASEYDFGHSISKGSRAVAAGNRAIS
jgi:hypothetical protein